jgi:hypothetical protein
LLIGAQKKILGVVEVLRRTCGVRPKYTKPIPSFNCFNSPYSKGKYIIF